jgi:hypothetical protein
VKTGVIDLRLRNQRLSQSQFRQPKEVVSWLGAVQAQDYAGAKWALGLRTKGVTNAMVERAFEEGRILRTHMLRPTWHFVAPADVRWMLSLSAPRVHAASASYYRKLELDPRTVARSQRIFARVLRGGNQLSRAELGAALDRAGIAATGMRLAAFVMHAELEQIVVSGPRRGKQFTYMLLDERAPNAGTLGREAALAELTRRYFTSHGPATIRDFVWWSGLTVREAKAGLEMNGSILAQETLGDLTYWLIPSRAAAPIASGSVHLLPNYDEYLIAYRDRGSTARLPTTADAPRGWDVYAQVLVVDGRFAGTWRRVQRAGVVEIAARPFTTLGRVHARALAVAVDRHGVFLGLPARLS